MHRSPAPFVRRAFVAAGVCLALSGCAVTWLSKYDATTDDITMAMQKNATIHAERMIAAAKPACFHDSFGDFYEQQHADLSALELRVSAIPKNQPTIDQVQSLRRALSDFEALHEAASSRQRCQVAAELTPAMSGLNVIFGAILKLEIAKQRGEKP